MPRRLYARGKLLLTAEYVVLEGALAVALPVTFGQILQIEENEEKADGRISWLAYEKGEEWFRAVFSDDLSIVEASHDKIGAALSHVLSMARILSGQKKLFQNSRIVTDTDYPRAWGLGSSSTLVALVAQYSGTNPYILQAGTFGGSGYDVACAFASGPIFYRRVSMANPEVKQANLPAIMQRWLYFVYSGRKQSSADEVARFKNLPATDKASAVSSISKLSERLTAIASFQELASLLTEHEEIIGRLIQKEPIQHQFPDFNGVLKSLGAWGGDFFLACTEMPKEEVVLYFENRGFGPVFSYNDLIYDKRLSQRNFRIIG